MSAQVPSPAHSLSTLSPNNDSEDTAPDDATHVEDIPPNGGYGWLCVAAVFMLNACAWGVNGAFGVFLAYYYAHDVFPGTTSFEFAFIGGLSISQALLVSPLITVSTRRWGVRTTLFIGVALLSIGLLGASFATQFWQLLLAQGGCFGWGMGFLYIGSVGIIPQWFDRRRSLAMGIATSGAGFGGLGFNLLTNALIERVGLASTLRTLATCSFVVSSICALVLRDRNKLVRPKQVAFDFRLFRRPEVLLIVGWGWMSELGYIVLYYSLPNYAASIGLSPRQGALAGALLNLGLAIGRPIIGYYSDQIGCINMAMLMTGFCGVLCLLVWIFARTYGVLLFFAIMAGTVCGTFWSTIAPVGTAIFGLKELPSALSMTWILLVLPCTFAEPIAVKMIGTTDHAWLRPQLFVGFMFLGASLCTLSLRSWKIIETRRKQERDNDHDESGPDSWAHQSTRQRVIRRVQAAFLPKRV